MLYARETIELMAAFPGREFRMAEIVNHVARGRPGSKQLRNRYRQGVRRVILALVDAKVAEFKQARRGGTTLYRWKCDMPCAESD